METRDAQISVNVGRELSESLLRSEVSSLKRDGAPRKAKRPLQGGYLAVYDKTRGCAKHNPGARDHGRRSETINTGGNRRWV